MKKTKTIIFKCFAIAKLTLRLEINVPYSIFTWPLTIAPQFMSFKQQKETSKLFLLLNPDKTNQMDTTQMNNYNIRSSRLNDTRSFWSYSCVKVLSSVLNSSKGLQSKTTVDYQYQLSSAVIRAKWNGTHKSMA